MRVYLTEREIAINTNYHLIKKMIIEDNITNEYNNHVFILKAAKWSYRKYGFGRASLYGYIEHIERLKNERLYNINVKLWKEVTSFVFKRDGFKCSYCGKIGYKLECDHIVPISKGGNNDLSNLTTSCQKCNRQKKDKSVDEFLKWKEYGKR